MRWRQVLPGEERQLGVLRQWAAWLLPPCPARDAVVVVANELASNAIKHTASGRGGWFAAEITWYGPVVRVAVADSGGPTAPHVIDDPAGEHGRGLLLVAGLSARTGACGDHRGRLMWADVRWDAGPVASADSYEAAIRDGQAALARRFGEVPAWFGRSTLAWWALTGPGELISAPSAQDLAALLYRLQGAPPPPRTHGTTQDHQDAGGSDGEGENVEFLAVWRILRRARLTIRGPHAPGQAFSRDSSGLPAASLPAAAISRADAGR